MEMTAVIAVIAMLTGLAALTISAKAGRNSLKKEAYGIINLMKQAQNAAAQSDRRYLVSFDELEQSYTLAQVDTVYDLPSSDSPDLNEEKVLSTTYLSEQCYFESIWYDDGIDTREAGEDENLAFMQPYFLAGKTGWQNGGMIRLLDSDGNISWIIVDRLSRNITLEQDKDFSEEYQQSIMRPIENLPF